MLQVCIDAAQLRKALKEIETAERNGFKHCLCVFNTTQIGTSLSDTIAVYSDLLEKGHPTDSEFNWGRFQGVTKSNKFIRGRLHPIKKQGVKK